MPFPAHGIAAGQVAFRIKQLPFPPACRFSPRPGIVPGETLFEIITPTDIGANIGMPARSENIDKAWLRFESGFKFQFSPIPVDQLGGITCETSFSAE